MNVNKHVIAATAATWLGFCAISANAKISGDVIKVGFITDISGLYAGNDGAGGAEAIRMAIADAGGSINGKKIELLVADHQNKADIASSKAREWFDQEGVDVLLGGVNSSAGLAMAKVAAEKKRLYINVGAGSTRLTNEECTPYTVHYAYSTSAMARSVGKAVLDAGGKNWFFLTADYAFGQSLEQETAAIVKASGGNVKGAVRHPLNAADFSSYMLQAQASGAKVLGLANGGPDTVNSIKAAREFGLTRSMKVAALLMDVREVHSIGLEMAQGMYLTTGWYWDRDEESRAWGKRYFGKVKSMPTMIQAADYSAATQYLKAVKATGTDDSDKVMAYLKANKINDMYTKGGVIRADGRMVYGMSLYEVKASAESKYPWDYLKLVSVVPGEVAYGPASESKCVLQK